MVLGVEIGTALKEFDDRWLMGYRNMHVIEVRVSRRLTLVLDSAATVDVEQEAILTYGSALGPYASPTPLVPARQDVAAALKLGGRKVLSSVAFKSGHLRIV